MKEYCVGLVFAAREHVLLVCKSHPEWQKGLRNGPGGLIEPGENAKQAMAREFTEETGAYTVPGDWEHRVTLRGGDWAVHYLTRFLPFRVDLPKVNTDEPVDWYDIEFVTAGPVVPDLRWVVPLCLDRTVRFPVNVYDDRDGGGPESPTPVEEHLATQLLSRRDVGLRKYGVSVTDRTDLTTDDWLQHAIEEVSDTLVYLERARRDLAKRKDDHAD